MKTCSVMVKSTCGLHARPAANLMKTAHKFKSDIRLVKAGQECNAKSLVDILRVGINYQDTVDIQCTGPDEDEALAAIKEYIENCEG